MSGFEPDLWGEYFVATAGIGAGLAGLVFVAFSINLRDILKYPGLVGRGAEALILLLSLAFIAMIGLWPADDLAWQGVGLLVIGIIAWSWLLTIVVKAGRDPGGADRPQHALRIGLGQVATLPTIIAGASLVAGVGPGLNVLVLGAVGSLIAGVVGAWVLLVEILR